MESAASLISKARAALVLDHPFYGALACKLTPVEAPDLTDTMATDGRSLFYNASFVQSQSRDELIGTLAHECMHPAMGHHARRGNRNPRSWNEAADYAINPILADSGFVLPGGTLNDPQYHGLSAEQIYGRLPAQSEDNNGNGPPGNGLKDIPGAVFDAPDPSADAAEWQVAVTQAANVARKMGKLPGHLREAVKQMTAPKVDWKPVLWKFAQALAAADYSWRRPSARYLARGLYLPELRSEALPPIVIVGDTSGSTWDGQAEFFAEMGAIVAQCQPESCHVISCDSQVQRVAVYGRGEPIEWHPEGGGGTNFCPAFDYVEEQGIQPACLIYLTDGYGDYPETAPGYPVLWAMTTDVDPPFGEVVRVSE